MSKVCFVICAIGDEGSRTRDRADKVLRHVIRPAGEDCEYQVIRSDEESQPNQITVDIVKHLRNDPMVIADLTHANPNVYYELGIRHCFRMPAVQIIDKNEPLPFDLGSQKTIPLDITDPDSIEECKELLIAQIKYAVDNPERITTPVSVAVDLEAAQASGDPSAQLTKVLLEKLESIESQVSAIGTSVRRPIREARTGVGGSSDFSNFLRNYTSHEDPATGGVNAYIELLRRLVEQGRGQQGDEEQTKRKDEDATE